jgi:hypothetical protein
MSSSAPRSRALIYFSVFTSLCVTLSYGINLSLLAYSTILFRTRQETCVSSVRCGWIPNVEIPVSSELLCRQPVWNSNANISFIDQCISACPIQPLPSEYLAEYLANLYSYNASDYVNVFYHNADSKCTCEFRHSDSSAMICHVSIHDQMILLLIGWICLLCGTSIYAYLIWLSDTAMGNTVQIPCMCILLLKPSYSERGRFWRIVQTVCFTLSHFLSVSLFTTFQYSNIASNHIIRRLSDFNCLVSISCILTVYTVILFDNRSRASISPEAYSESKRQDTAKVKGPNTANGSNANTSNDTSRLAPLEMTGIVVAPKP